MVDPNVFKCRGIGFRVSTQALLGIGVERVAAPVGDSF